MAEPRTVSESLPFIVVVRVVACRLSLSLTTSYSIAWSASLCQLPSRVIRWLTPARCSCSPGLIAGSDCPSCSVCLTIGLSGRP
ncbi:TPA: hypothetical protein ACY3IJ_002259 [Enterobacter asburiae]